MTNKRAPEAGQGFEGQAPQKGTKMDTHTVAVSSAPRTAQVVPGLSQIIAVQREIDELAERRDRLSRQVLDDARFMDAPVLELRPFWVDGIRDAHVGDVFHVADFEAAGVSGFDAHPADACRSDWCCTPVGEARGSGRRGPRRRTTNRGSWVLVVEPDASGRAVFVASVVAA